jgi:hypothetical protein
MILSVGARLSTMQAQARRSRCSVAETARAVRTGLERGIIMRVRSVSILAALIVGVAVPGVAQAAPPLENSHYDFVDVGSFDDCGFTIDFESTETGHFMVREVEGSGGQAFLGHDNYQFRDVLTNPETGAFMVVHGRGLVKEFTARHVDGNIWEFTLQDVGQPFTIEDSDGNVVSRDRGRVTFRQLFDTLGDGQPGGELLEEEIISVSGPHPSIDTDFCAIATDLIG